jgi:hypothetical protein
MILGITTFDILLIVVVVLLVIFTPILIRMRINSSINRSSLELEGMVNESKKNLKKLCIEKGKPEKDPSKDIDNFMDFFIVPPVDLDPAGLMQKFQKIMELGEDRFKHMADIIAPNADDEWKANISMTLKATIAINGVAKMVRHNLELSKKTGSLQILIMLQMGLPMIMRIVRAQYEGTKLFSECKPIGDGVGPLVTGILMKDVPDEDIEEINDIVIGKSVIKDVNVIIARAKGPGARVGRIGKTVTSIMEKEKIKRLITIDAAQKLEGEETGSVAEGIGVVIGGPGIDKWVIEEEMIKKDLQVDAVVVKMSPEESIEQMTQKIVDSALKALEVLETSILLSEAGNKIMVLGVGNSSGIPNIVKDISKINIKQDNKKGN